MCITPKFKIKDSFGIPMTSRFQNLPHILNLVKIWWRYWQNNNILFCEHGVYIVRDLRNLCHTLGNLNMCQKANRNFSYLVKEPKYYNISFQNWAFDKIPNLKIIYWGHPSPHEQNNESEWPRQISVQEAYMRCGLWTWDINWWINCRMGSFGEKWFL